MDRGADWDAPLVAREGTMARRKAAAVLASAAVLLAAAIVLVPCGPGDGAPRPALGPRPARPGPADGFFGEPGESGTPPAPRAGDGSSSIRGSGRCGGRRTRRAASPSRASPPVRSTSSAPGPPVSRPGSWGASGRAGRRSASSSGTGPDSTARCGTGTGNPAPGRGCGPSSGGRGSRGPRGGWRSAPTRRGGTSSRGSPRWRGRSRPPTVPPPRDPSPTPWRPGSGRSSRTSS